MKNVLREQKQELVRDALYGAAVELFARGGFEETTIEEIANAAGVSRSTFFRHFDGKDDVLVHPMASYAAVLIDGIRSSPREAPPLEVVRVAVIAGARFTMANEERTRQLVTTSFRSTAARQAYQLRMLALEQSLALAYAKWFGDGEVDLRPWLLAGLTGTVINAGILSWFRGEEPDLFQALEEALAKIRSIICEDGHVRTSSSAKSDSKPIRKPRTRTPRDV